MIDKTINKKVESLLRSWGKTWYQELVSDAYGYPTKSIEGKLIDGGGVIINSTARYERILIDSSLIAIDKIIGDLLLDKDEKTTGIVLQLNYIGQSPQKKKAKILNMTINQYQYYLRSGKLYVAGRLNIKHNQKVSV